MKTVQVIEQLKDLIEDRKSFLDENGVGDEVFRADIEALEIAIEALEKQIPMKVTGYKTKVKARDVELNEIATFTCMKCPNCEVWQSGNDKYCSRCGQRLDWTGKEGKHVFL